VERDFLAPLLIWVDVLALVPFERGLIFLPFLGFYFGGPRVSPSLFSMLNGGDIPSDVQNTFSSLVVRDVGPSISRRRVPFPFVFQARVLAWVFVLPLVKSLFSPGIVGVSPSIQRHENRYHLFVRCDLLEGLFAFFRRMKSHQKGFFKGQPLPPFEMLALSLVFMLCRRWSHSFPFFFGPWSCFSIPPAGFKRLFF